MTAMLRLLGVRTPVVLTLNTGALRKGIHPVARVLWPLVSQVITSTEYTRTVCAEAGVEVKVVRPGLIRDLRRGSPGALPAHRHRVLFWRDPSHQNGADLCVRVFSALAGQYPHLSFDLAVRPHSQPVDGIAELVDTFDNVTLYQVPYPEGIDLETLMQESLCVLLPFRRLSTHPQLSVLETMAAGAALVTTDLESNKELIESGVDGYLVPVDDYESTLATVSSLITDSDLANRIGQSAAETVAKNWSWDDYLEQLLDTYSGTASKRLLRAGH